MRFLVLYNGRVHPDSGAGGTVWQTNRALEELGHEVHVISESDVRRSVRHHNLHYAFELPSRVLQTVRAHLEHERFDVLLLSQPYGYLVGKWLRRQSNWPAGAPVYLHRSHGHELVAAAQVASLRDRFAEDARPAWRRGATEILQRRLVHQARLALRYADGTIVPSDFDRDYLLDREAVEAESVRTIHHASTPEYVSAAPLPYTPERHRRMLYVGNLTAIKGLGVLPMVVGDALRRFHDVRLSVVSPRDDHDRLRGRLDADLLSRIDFLDWVDQRQLMAIYDSHGVQLIPSLYEGASKAHYEGMSRGLCLAGSAVGAMRDSVEHGVNGMLAAAGDAAGLSAAVGEILENYDAAARMGAAALVTSREYTWHRTASEIVDFAAAAAARRGERP